MIENIITSVVAFLLTFYVFFKIFSLERKIKLNEIVNNMQSKFIIGAYEILKIHHDILQEFIDRLDKLEQQIKEKHNE